MARGFLAGMIWGAVASVVGVGAVSVLSDAPGPSMPRPVAEAPTVAPATAEEPAPGNAEATAPAPEPATAPPSAETTMPEPEAEETAEPEPVPAPEVAETAAVPTEDPDSAGRRPEPDSAVDRPAAPDAGLPSQAVPGSVGAETAPPAPPAVGQAPEAPQAETATGRPAPVTVTTEAPVMPGAQAEAPGAVSPDAPPLADAAPAQPPAPPVPSVESPLVPDAAGAPAGAASVASDEATTDTPAAESAEPAMPTPTADVTEDAPAIGQPAVSLVERDGAVQQDRLPRIGDAPDEAAGIAETAPDAEIAADTPLLANAAEVSVPDGVPRMAVVLVDDGRGPLGPATLQAFPFPVSFAIDPAHPDPAGAAEAYRALGFEVLSIARPPEGATASDVDVTLAGALAAVPQSVAVLEAPDGAGLGSDRAVISQAAAYLARSGHGLVLMPRGLNTAQQFAAREGVPAMTLFRDFDGEGQDATVIRRTLDQAAFRARQEGGVVMLGRLRADTISALVLWGLQDREGSLALVPVSVVLREAAAE
ncbi:divergent polysaccharide deacetylase family protein [Thetidibacter halocola]|uniref:Divergent polysaccharide deacetylase family protein n=1 Tax=Thetidibacter halocola TaxID=2827239 RepID=A0A8J7WCT2_9RHOB|nr:divergent polysaccharide deacetylase family protein [Thetidibacter halocola]MBS0123023.1 divergent polysaccharide deacetylase family protein [Thetidibacter halocola]